MTGPHRYSLPVERRRDVGGTVTFEHEGERAGLVGCCAEQPDARHGGDQLHRVADELLLVAVDASQAELGDVVERSGQADRVGDAARARLELGRRLGVPGALEGHVADHVPAALPGRHLGQDLWLGVEHADSGWAEHLVAGERIEVHVERVHVDRHVSDRLRAVDQHTRTSLVGGLDHLLDRYDGAEHVRDVRDRHQLGPVAEQGKVAVEHKPAGLVDPDDRKPGTHPVGELLPRHDIGVVLKLRQHDLVAAADVHAAPRLGDEIDRLCGSPGENDAVGGRRADEFRDLRPGVFVGVRCPGGECVRAAVNVGVLVAVEIGDPVDDLPRLLRGSGVVEPDKRPPADPLAKDREVGAHGVHVERAARCDPLRARGGR